MKKKTHFKEKQAEKIYLRLIEEKQRQIDKLKSEREIQNADEEYLYSEIDNISRLFHQASNDAQRQMATTKYIVIVNLLMETLSKSLVEHSPMESVVKKAIFEYKKALSEGMLLFKFNGENCVYDPTDEDELFKKEDYDK